MAKSYSDKLKDPRWQKKRLEILSRDEFKCRACDNNEETLHVHHLRYEKNAEPWEVKNDDLITLCASCHDAATYINAADKYGIGYECISLVVQLFDKMESDAIDKYLKECKKRDAELGIKHDDEF